MNTDNYPFKETEEKWQRVWEEQKLYRTDMDNTAKKLYCLVMFIYPSADRLHIGHWYNYGPADTWARFKRMQGYNVFEPMGYDAFGLPAENYAIQQGIHPAQSTAKNIHNIRKQLGTMGAMYDWSKEINTSSPEYYKWTQWFFLQLYKHGLAYRKKAPVNWCPGCQTVLANEQVINGACERCDTAVTKKDLAQWFFKITAYADRLLEGHAKINWPEKTLAMQKNWIGRSEGALIRFDIEEDGRQIEVFTTRPDTLYGMTYLVLAPEHQLVSELVSGDRRKEVEEYVERTRRITEIERTSTEKEKTGLFIGRNVINPVNSERVPIWISDYVLESYGTGAVFACPAHDQRDFEFANKFGLKIQEVVRPPQGPSPLDEMKAAYLDSGVMVNSGPYNGLSNRECSRKIVDDLSCHVGAEKTVQYKLRDWLISRQRYWGTPIPIIYCPRCGEVPVPEEELPVFLPEKVEFKVAGESPLTTNPDFVNTPCPRCGEPGRREVDTMDTFVCSSWYFLRFVDPDIDSFPFNRGLANKWLPVDQYVGGAEHAVMHLLYARFFTMALHDMGLIDFEEPFLKLNHQGMIRNNAYFCPRHGYLPKDRTERDGKNLCCTTCGYPLEIRDEKISKSKYNSVDPEQYIHQYGADTFRMYLMFMGSYEEGGVWSEKGITGIHRFVNRVWRLVNLLQKTPPEGWETGKSPELERLRHYTIREVTGDLEGFHFNTAISRLMELTNSLYLYIQDVPPEEQHREILKTTEEALITLLAPFAPHLSEELWHRIGGEHSIFDQTWPAYDEDKILLEKVTIAIQVNGKLRDQMEAPLDIEDELLKEMALSQQKIKKYVEGHRILKTIVVKNKLLNIVVQ